MYDWANSAMVTTIITAVFPIYYASVACKGVFDPEEATRRYATATVIGMVIIALLSPVLGTIADLKGDKKKMLGGFLALGSASVAGMFFIYQGDWILASVLFILANIGANGSFVFYDALLPHVAREDEIDRVSTAGYALGYIGGGTLLALNLAWIMKPAWFGLPSGDRSHSGAGARFPRGWHSCRSRSGGWSFRSRCFAAFPSRLPPERARPAVSRPGGIRALVGDRPRLARPQAGVPDAARVPDLQRRHRHDHPHGDDLRRPRSRSIRTIDDRLDHDRAVRRHSVRVPLRHAGPADRRQAIDRLGLVAYMAICIFGYFMTSATHFVVLAILVGAVQGGTQALSRSLFASLIPRDKSGEFFGFFGVAEKFAGILGPARFRSSRRVEPKRDPGDHRVLRRRRSAAVLRRRRRRPATGAGRRGSGSASRAETIALRLVCQRVSASGRR